MVKHPRLSLLTIYNPSLGRSEETLRDQIVFYWSAQADDEKKKATATATDDATTPNVSSPTDRHERENEKLRQVGLAQGMVDFARTFSDDGDVDTAECEKSRVVVKELEPGWWILASIDFACFPVFDPSTSPTLQPQQTPSPSPAQSYEYSSRDIAPAHLLIQNLLRAHHIFLLHNGVSLDALFKDHSRLHFSFSLARFWRRFIYNWDVCLSGNPAVDIYNGLKVSASGELGVGVGEEEWGSGERCVLEDIIAGNENIVDLMVARFGDEAGGEVDHREDAEKNYNNNTTNTNNDNHNHNHNSTAASTTNKPASPWLGFDKRPSAADGIIFSGIGAVTRTSLCRMSHWMEWVFQYGEYAYGIKNDPRVIRPPKSRKPRSLARGASSDHDNKLSSLSRNRSRHRTNRGRRTARSEAPTVHRSPKIPPPLVTTAQTLQPQSQEQQQESARITKSKSAEIIAASTNTTDNNGSNSNNNASNNKASAQSRIIEEVYDSLGFSTDTFKKLVTLGYGSAWGNGKSAKGNGATVQSEVDDLASEVDVDASNGEGDEEDEDARDGIGRFLLGFKGNLTNDDQATNDRDDSTDVDSEKKDIVLRELTVEMNSGGSRDGPSACRDVKAVVYVHRPFMYLILFDKAASCLDSAAFYRTLIQHHLNPLHKPLLRPTCPLNPQDRTMALLHRLSARDAHSFQEHPLYDLISDPITRTIQTSLPGIPDRGRSRNRGMNTPAMNDWTRADALNVHMQILTVYAQTRARKATSEVEKTTKTGRNWWVVWVRDGVPGGGSDDDSGLEGAEEGSMKATTTTGIKEAFLVRRSTDGSKSSAIESPSRVSAAATAHATAGDGGGMVASSSTKETGGSAGADSSEGGHNGGGGVGNYYYNLLAGRASTINHQTTRLTEGIGVDTKRYIQGLFNSGR